MLVWAVFAISELNECVCDHTRDARLLWTQHILFSRSSDNHIKDVSSGCD